LFFSHQHAVAPLALKIVPGPSRFDAIRDGWTEARINMKTGEAKSATGDFLHSLSVPNSGLAKTRIDNTIFAWLFLIGHEGLHQEKPGGCQGLAALDILDRHFGIAKAGAGRQIVR
jgi:hypothetical protein